MIAWLLHHLVTVWVVSAATVIVGVVCTPWLIVAVPAATGVLLVGWFRWIRSDE